MLTPREQDTYHFIERYCLKHGKAPMQREIAAGIGINSQGVVHRYLRSLQKKGLLALTDGHRGIQLTKKIPPGHLPLLGRISAGKPIEAIPDQDEVNLIELMGGPNKFVLKVKGDSMIDAGILDGDLVVCEKRETARNNEIVVALIDESEATLKSLRKNKDGTVSLVPANSKLSPMIYAANRVRIQGVVVGQMRTYR